jgi:hypothetical protein
MRSTYDKNILFERLTWILIKSVSRQNREQQEVYIGSAVREYASLYDLI